MSDTAEITGPLTRRRRTTVGAGDGKQANGGKWHEVGDKPPQRATKGGKRTEQVSKQASYNGKPDRDAEPRVKRQHHQQQFPDSPMNSVVDDISEKLR